MLPSLISPPLVWSVPLSSLPRAAMHRASRGVSVSFFICRCRGKVRMSWVVSQGYRCLRFGRGRDSNLRRGMEEDRVREVPASYWLVDPARRCHTGCIQRHPESSYSSLHFSQTYAVQLINEQSPHTVTVVNFLRMRECRGCWTRSRRLRSHWRNAKWSMEQEVGFGDMPTQDRSR